MLRVESKVEDKVEGFEMFLTLNFLKNSAIRIIISLYLFIFVQKNGP